MATNDNVIIGTVDSTVLADNLYGCQLFFCGIESTLMQRLLKQFTNSGEYSNGLISMAQRLMCLFQKRQLRLSEVNVLDKLNLTDYHGITTKVWLQRNYSFRVFLDNRVDIHDCRNTANHGTNDKVYINGNCCMLQRRC